MDILTTIIQTNLIHKLGWTLLHFIWQGTIIAIILTIALKCVRQKAATLRYTIACIALTLIVIAPAVTFFMIPSIPQITAQPTVSQLSTEPIIIANNQPNTSTPEIQSAPPELPKPQLTQPQPLPPLPLKQRISEAVQPFLPYTVFGWFMGVCCFSFLHMGGFLQLQKLRKRLTKPVPQSITDSFNVLSSKLAVKKTVSILESALVQIPTVIGHLKPIILIPTAVLTNLTPDQLQAILAHELAHIKRNDYLINLIQTAIEILGFYHPAVWWISRKIRIERENCCDDIAVQLTSDKFTYARALAMLEEVRPDNTKLAVAASGAKLADRIRRLLTSDQKETRPNLLPSIMAMLLIIAVIAVPNTLIAKPTTAESLKEILLTRERSLNSMFAEYSLSQKGYVNDESTWPNDQQHRMIFKGDLIKYTHNSIHSKDGRIYTEYSNYGGTSTSFQTGDYVTKKKSPSGITGRNSFPPYPESAYLTPRWTTLGYYDGKMLKDRFANDNLSLKTSPEGNDVLVCRFYEYHIDDQSRLVKIVSKRGANGSVNGIVEMSNFKEINGFPIPLKATKKWINKEGKCLIEQTMIVNPDTLKINPVLDDLDLQIVYPDGTTALDIRTNDDKEINVHKILQKTRDLYRNMSTFSCQTRIVSDINGKVESHHADMILSRTGQYNIQWQRDKIRSIKDGYTNSPNGKEHYVYLRGKNIGKINKLQQPAFSTKPVINLCNGTSTIIPPLFYFEATNLLNILQHPMIRDYQTINNIPCYVISGSIEDLSYRFWIDEDMSLIYQVQISYDSVNPSSAAPSMTDEQIRNILKKTKPNPTQELIENYREQANARNFIFAKYINTKIIHTFYDIHIDEPVSDSDFTPADSKTTTKENLSQSLNENNLQLESMTNMRTLGLMLAKYANDHSGSYPETLDELLPFDTTNRLPWLLEHVEYYAQDKSVADAHNTPLAIDKSMLMRTDKTNVLFNDGFIAIKASDELEAFGMHLKQITPS